MHAETVKRWRVPAVQESSPRRPTSSRNRRGRSARGPERALPLSEGPIVERLLFPTVPGFNRRNEEETTWRRSSHRSRQHGPADGAKSTPGRAPGTGLRRRQGADGCARCFGRRCRGKRQGRGERRRSRHHHAAGRTARPRRLHRRRRGAVGGRRQHAADRFSTIDVESARAVAAAAEKKGLRCSTRRSPAAPAARRRYTFMVGGSDVAFERAKPILEKNGQDDRARRRRRQRSGGEDLQQHDPRHIDDRGVGSICAGREARPRRASCSTSHRSRRANAGR